MSSGKNISVITLGCAKNEVDSDKMRARLRSAGYLIVDDPSRADLTVINTCAFLTSAVDEGIDTILDLLGVSEDESIDPNKVIVCGCIPARYGKDLEAELPEVAAFLPVKDEELIVEAVNKALGNDFAPIEGPSRIVEGPAAYLKISEGCDRFCSYCMIPYIRGRYYSIPYEELRAEVAELVEGGKKEIVLIGQDTGIWGQDFETPSSITELLRKLSSEFADTWFRVLYIQPEGINDEFLRTMSETPNICSYIDIPLQHVDAEVLERMNRSGDPKQISELIAHIREMVPGIMIRTTFMTGFPGETDDQFELMLNAAEEIGFDYAGVFAYSTEEGTKAAEFEDQIDEDIRMERAQRLLDVCDACGFERTKQHIGEEVECIVEAYELTDVGVEALARWQGQAPDVDGMVHIPMEDPDQFQIGDKVRVRFVDSFCYELEGELL